MRCVNTCASTDGARRAQNCALYTSVCSVVSVPLFAMCSRLFMLCVRMYAVCRSQMFVNMRCRIHSLYRLSVTSSKHSGMSRKRSSEARLPYCPPSSVLACEFGAGRGRLSFSPLSYATVSRGLDVMTETT